MAQTSIVQATRPAIATRQVTPPYAGNKKDKVAIESLDEVDSDDLEAERNYEIAHQFSNENIDDEAFEKQLDNELQWTKRQAHLDNAVPRLRRPVVIPQTAPTLVSLFQRAWAPDLAAHDVPMEEWLEFVDHLNVCKAGTPPLQVLNLAGTAVGFVPHHWFTLAGIATNAVAIGGMIGVARVRIARYLKRANEEYFVPRKLIATIAKQKTIHEITGQDADAPMLSDSDSSQIDAIQRRMEAFNGTIADLQLESLSEPGREDGAIDRMSAKMNAMKTNRAAKKDEKKKQAAEDGTVSKHEKKLAKERKKRYKEECKIRKEADKEIRKSPEKAEKEEKKMQKELRKLQKEDDSDLDEYLEKTGKGGKKVEKKMKRLMFIVVQNLDDYMAQKKAATGSEGLR